MDVTCPHCGRTGTTLNAISPGATVRCPGCRQPFSYAAPPDDPPDPLISIDTSARAVLFTPPEPWFYRWLDKSARFGFAICMALLTLALAIGFYIGLHAYLNLADPAAGIFWGVLLTLLPPAIEVLSLSGFATFCLLIRLAVDHARNVRAIRFRP